MRLNSTLTSCAGEPVSRLETVRLLPSAPLLADCPEPALAGDTWRAVIAHTLALKTALREWAAEQDR